MAESRPTPLIHEETRPWWDATRRGELLVQRCQTCGAHQHYPRSLCLRCQSTHLSFVTASGHGTIYSFTTVFRSVHPALPPPYVIALVRLAEGPLMLSRIVGTAPEALRCDQPVVVDWDPLPDGYQLPVFRSAES